MNTNPKQLLLNDQPYYIIPKGLMSAKTFTSKATGEIIDVSLSDKMVLMHLIDKVSFHNQSGRTMFESMPAIAEELALSAKSVQRSVEKLRKHNVVYATAKSAAKGNVYHSIDVQQDWNKGEMSVSNKERSKPNPISIHTPVASVGMLTESIPDHGIPEWCKEAVDAPQIFRDDLEDYENSVHIHSQRHTLTFDFNQHGDLQ